MLFDLEHKGRAMTILRHPIERAIRRYLIEGRQIDNTLLPVYCQRAEGDQPDVEIQNEKQIDKADVERISMEKYLSLSWESLQHEAAYIRYINRRQVQPELMDCLHYDDILAAKGGINDSNDELSLDDDNRRNAIDHIPVRLNVEEIVVIDEIMAARDADDTLKGKKAQVISQAKKDADAMLTSTSTLLDDDANEENASIIGELIELPKRKVFELLGATGYDARGGGVPLWAIDPYPAQRKGETAADAKTPMAAVMYEWLSKHMIVSRPDKCINPASGDRGTCVSLCVSLCLSL